MNSIFLKSFLSILLVSVLLSCTSNSETLISDQNRIENNIVLGTWSISKFIDSGNNETSDYTYFSFSFKSDGILISNKDSQTYTGFWNITKDHSNDDHIDDLDFNIQFSSPDKLEELSEDWQIISTSANKIEFIHISGGNGGTDYLTFHKN